MVVLATDAFFFPQFSKALGTRVIICFILDWDVQYLAEGLMCVVRALACVHKAWRTEYMWGSDAVYSSFTETGVIAISYRIALTEPMLYLKQYLKGSRWKAAMYQTAGRSQERLFESDELKEESATSYINYKCVSVSRTQTNSL